MSAVSRNHTYMFTTAGFGANRMTLTGVSAASVTQSDLLLA
jgi:hypothetical protein